ncbi:MAG TPA: macro domain-containing protein [Pyrinomonadaceae bacterium]|nr:macro domain-containing protein [Pyrinomonadaceae bacterium]
MITYVAGNLFTSPAQVLVNTVNTQGVMGKGIALQFKKTYPEMFKTYQDLCERGKIDIGVLWIYKTPHKWILNFPTKKYWRNPSKAEYIEIGLKKFLERFNELSIYSIAFPALGCGNGELDWEDTVKPLMEKYLNKVPADVFVHPPLSREELPEHKDKKEIEKWLRSEPATLSFNEVWRDLRELLSKKSSFLTSKTASTFRAKLLESDSKKLIEDSNNGFLVIEAKNGTRKIEYEQLLELWQQFRRHGYLRRGIVSSAIEKELSYLIPILSELEYVEVIELSETGHFLNTTGKKTYSGLQYMAPIRSEQPTLFSL